MLRNAHPEIVGLRRSVLDGSPVHSHASYLAHFLRLDLFKAAHAQFDRVCGEGKGREREREFERGGLEGADWILQWSLR